MKYFAAAALMWFIVAPSPASASDVLLLVHGYFSNHQAWRESGVTQALERAGWADGGGWTLGSARSRDWTQPLTEDARAYYRADLPSEASLRQQAEPLRWMASEIRRRHPEARLFLVGHSAGGVAARLLMVTNPEMKITGLVTIASPHLGTEAAQIALLAGQTPLALIAPFFGGGSLNRSQALYADLSPARPGSFLDRLNHAPHPDATYLSIIHDQGRGAEGDLIVSPTSQDMRRVPALAEKARAIQIVAGHGLTETDGAVLIHVFQQNPNQGFL